MRVGFVYDDGGRAAAGHTTVTKRDCVVRAIAIATGKPYEEVRQRVAEFADGDGTKGVHRKRTEYAERGYEDLLREWGWYWTATMRIGQGCRVHLCAEELPAGRIIVRLSRHLVAVIDGVIHDTHDPRRPMLEMTEVAPGVHRTTGRTYESRCVYGYFAQLPLNTMEDR